MPDRPIYTHARRAVPLGPPARIPVDHSRPVLADLARLIVIESARRHIADQCRPSPPAPTPDRGEPA